MSIKITKRIAIGPCVVVVVVVVVACCRVRVRANAAAGARIFVSECCCGLHASAHTHSTDTGQGRPACHNQTKIDCHSHSDGISAWTTRPPPTDHLRQSRREPMPSAAAAASAAPAAAAPTPPAAGHASHRHAAPLSLQVRGREIMRATRHTSNPPKSVAARRLRTAGYLPPPASDAGSPRLQQTRTASAPTPWPSTPAPSSPVGTWPASPRPPRTGGGSSWAMGRRMVRAAVPRAAASCGGTRCSMRWVGVADAVCVARRRRREGSPLILTHHLVSF